MLKMFWRYWEASIRVNPNAKYVHGILLSIVVITSFMGITIDNDVLPIILFPLYLLLRWVYILGKKQLEIEKLKPPPS